MTSASYCSVVRLYNRKTGNLGEVKKREQRTVNRYWIGKEGNWAVDRGRGQSREKEGKQGTGQRGDGEEGIGWE